MQVECAYCGKKTNHELSAVNRARKKGALLFCNRLCFGLNRRSHKSKAQKTEEKRLYDNEYRMKNKEMLRAKKAAYFRETYDPVRAAEDRKKNMHRHVEYCRSPEYREYKSDYDKKYRSKKFYEEFWESFLLVENIDREVNSRMSDYEVRVANGTINKQLQRRRVYERLISIKSENCPLGNA